MPLQVSHKFTNLTPLLLPNCCHLFLLPTMASDNRSGYCMYGMSLQFKHVLMWTSLAVVVGMIGKVEISS